MLFQQRWRYFFSDLVVLNLGLAASYWLRFKFMGGELAEASVLALVSLLWSVFFVLHSLRIGLHQELSIRARFESFVGVLKVQAFSFVAVVFSLYFIVSSPFSRLALGFSLLFSTLSLLAVRIFIVNFLKKKSLSERSQFKLFIVGSTTDAVKAEIEKFKSDGFSFSANVTLNSEQVFKSLQSQAFSVTSDVFLISDDISSHELGQLLPELSKTLLQVRVLQKANTSPLGGQVQVHTGYMSYSMNSASSAYVDIVLKRALDFVLCTLGLIVLSPLFLLIALGVKLSSPGPIFYSQKRIGKNGQEFKMWKFRSMKVSAENQPGWTTANDDRRTLVGTFIRKTSIDELPQLWNVVCGDMSLVGPRPEQPHFVNLFSKEITYYHLRHKVPVGITGWAQVNGLRGDTSIQTRIEYDLQYIKSWSLWFDVKIIILTFVKGFLNKNAY